jgi:hypothetical protein
MELNVHLTPTDGEPLEDPTRPDISYSESVYFCSHSNPL